MSSSEIEQIYATALKILAELGIGESPDTLTQQALSKGASLSDTGRLCFPKAMVENIIAGACKEFVLPGREAKHDIEIGGKRVYYGTGGAAVQTLDLDTHTYRPSTLEDLYDFTRLADTLNNVSWFTRCCIATDVTDITELDINTAYALIKGLSLIHI